MNINDFKIMVIAREHTVPREHTMFTLFRDFLYNARPNNTIEVHHFVTAHLFLERENVHNIFFIDEFVVQLDNGVRYITEFYYHESSVDLMLEFKLSV